MVQLCQAQLSLVPGLVPCLDLGLGPGLRLCSRSVCRSWFRSWFKSCLGHGLDPCPGLEGFRRIYRRIPWVPEGSQDESRRFLEGSLMSSRRVL